MSEIHDVLHTLIDVASGAQAHLNPHEATLLHEGVDKALADSTALDGPDTAPEPSGDEAPAPAPSDAYTNVGDPVAG